jgi:hypothetical protein
MPAQHKTSQPSSATSAFAKVRLLLAREPGHPAGSHEHGYDLVLPLRADGRIHAERWREERDRFRFTHFSPEGGAESGRLVHKPGGSWGFLYDDGDDEEDASGFRFETERFVRGEYVSIREDDGAHTYQVASVTPL